MNQPIQRGDWAGEVKGRIITSAASYRGAREHVVRGRGHRSSAHQGTRPGYRDCGAAGRVDRPALPGTATITPRLLGDWNWWAPQNGSNRVLSGDRVCMPRNGTTGLAPLRRYCACPVRTARRRRWPTRSPPHQRFRYPASRFRRIDDCRDAALTEWWYYTRVT